MVITWSDRQMDGQIKGYYSTDRQVDERINGYSENRQMDG